MNKTFNALFLILKVLMLFGTMILTLYIMYYMYQRLEKDITGIIPTLLPYAILLILFAINFIARQKSVNRNIFYNIVCCVVLSFILFACYRAIYDDFMILKQKLGYSINFNYFADLIPVIRVLLYGLCLTNFLLMFDRKKESKLKIQ